VGKDMTYEDLLKNYRKSELEISVLKKQIKEQEIASRQKRDYGIDRLIFEDSVTQFVNQLPLIVYQSDINGDFLFLNGFALKSFGYTDNDFKNGINVRQILHDPKDFNRYKNDIKERLSQKEIKGRRYTLRKKDGSVFHGLIYSTAIISTDKKPMIFGVVLDHTEYQEMHNELVETQSSLKELNMAKDKLFSIIAHDLKNPFNAISGFSDLLLSGIKDYPIEQIESYVKIISKSATKGYNLLENLLEWTRSQTGQLKIKKDDFNLARLVQENIEFSKERALGKGIELIADCNQPLIVHGDRNMISTVLRNLLNNALKFTKSGGLVTISTQRLKTSKNEKPFAKIVVEDTGIGIKKTVLDKLFRFEENLSTPGTDFEHGTGLGLVLCKDFIEKNNGEIWVESEVNKGSCFCFSLPLRI
jgi:PAS domain S-box-containing protein